MQNRVDAGVTVLLINGSASGAAGNDSLSGFENVEGSRFGDVLYGDFGDNALSGNDCDDTLFAYSGNDTFSGGAGNDTFIFVAGYNPLVSLTDFGGGDRISLQGVASLSGPSTGDGSAL